MRRRALRKLLSRLRVQVDGKSRALLPTERATLLAIADRDGDGRGSWPSHSTLAEEVGVDRVTVIRTLDRLASFGLVVAHERWSDTRNGRRRRQSNRYEVLWERLESPFEPVDSTPRGSGAAPPPNARARYF